MRTEKNNKGPHIGKVSVRQTIRTIAPGECCVFQPGEVNAEYASSACSKESKLTGSRFTVSSRRELGGKVIICRCNDTTENQ